MKLTQKNLKQLIGEEITKIKEAGGLVGDVPIHDISGDKADDVKNMDTVLGYLMDAHHASAFDRALQGAIDRLIADIQDRMAEPMGLE